MRAFSKHQSLFYHYHCRLSAGKENSLSDIMFTSLSIINRLHRLFPLFLSFCQPATPRSVDLFIFSIAITTFHRFLSIHSTTVKRNPMKSWLTQFLSYIRFVCQFIDFIPHSYPYVCFFVDLYSLWFSSRRIDLNHLVCVWCVPYYDRLLKKDNQSDNISYLMLFIVWSHIKCSVVIVIEQTEQNWEHRKHTHTFIHSHK